MKRFLFATLLALPACLPLPWLDGADDDTDTSTDTGSTQGTDTTDGTTTDGATDGTDTTDTGGTTDDGLTAWAAGLATYYGNNPGSTACTWPDPDAIPGYGNAYLAVGADNWADGLGCGDVYEVICTGPDDPGNTSAGVCATQGAPVYVVAADRCPECNNTHLDLTETVFDRLWDGDIGALGRMAIELRRVQGDYGVPIRLNLLAGSSQFYFAFHQQYANRRIVEVEWRDADDTAWNTVTRDGALWVADNVDNATLPISFRVTNEAGDDLEAIDVMTSFEGAVALGVNF